MNNKIATLLQLSNLNIGDIITRYPTNGDATDKFVNVPGNTDVFQIRSINAQQVLELVAPCGSVPVYASAGDVRRLFIKSADILTENTWWYDTDK